MRKISDIGKYRRIVSRIIRSKKIFIHKKKIANTKYLNVGCGPKIFNEFINLDLNWRPGIDICWNLEKSTLPFDQGSLKGIYTEHVLEHISMESCIKVLSDFHRFLVKGGVLRIIVPDAELFFTLYVKKLHDPDVYIPYEENFITPAMRINALYKNHGHKVIYDYYTLEKLLKKSGFNTIERLKFKVGNDSKLLIDSEERVFESLYIEAIK